MFWHLSWRDLPSLIWFAFTRPAERKPRTTITCPLCMGRGELRR